MKLINEQQERMFLNEGSATAFFKEQESAEIWRNCYANEIGVFPVPGASCALYDADSVRKSCGMDGTKISDETIEETLNSTKLGLSVPLVKREVYPLSNVAFATLMQRAGYSSAPVLGAQKSKPNQLEMSAIDKANVLNIGLNCFKNKVLILIRDEKVRAVLSGDESDYSRLPVSQLYAKMKEIIGKLYPDWKFTMSTVSHLFTTILVRLNDKRLETEIADTFKKARIDYRGEPMVRMVTSDVGLSGANIFPVLRDKIGKEMPIGLPICLTHNNRHTVEDFGKNVALITSMFRDSKDKLEQMMITPIKHPAGCLKVIGKKCTLPKKLTCNEAKVFQDMYKNAYEIDVYYKLFDILDEYANENNLSSQRILEIQESIARVVFSNMSEYDYEWEWE